MIGQSIAHYRITAKLGEGGMGVVYRATDTKLNRDVAIKVLPEAFAADPDRLARFEREAKVLASLNHPNIAAIYGIEDRALIMELVEGDTLQGPLPIDAAITYAHQIADALDAAHEKGIIHRDLKPANIKITPEGQVKVLDFGLARIAEPAASTSSNPEASPTLTMRATAHGLIMGTAAYMSPEQARGQAADKRADIWSFGVVLYEMLTGKQLFAGETVSDTLAAVLKQEIDLSKLPPATPPALRRLLTGCLERDRKKRLRDIGDVAWGAAAPAEAPSTLTRTPRWVPVALLLTAALAAVAGWLFHRPKPVELPLFTSSFPVDKLTIVDYHPAAALSPNGKFLAYVRADRLWVRDLERDHQRQLEGTENADGPFWSPDSASIAYAAGRELKRLPRTGGVPVTVARLDGPYRGGAWSPDGSTILVSTIAGGLSVVSATGGTPRIFKPRDQAFYRPQFITSSRGELFILTSVGTRSNQKLALINYQTGQLRILRDGGYACYSGGYLLFYPSARESAIWAQPFSTSSMTLQGHAAPLIDKGGRFSVSANGYLTWIDSDILRLHQLVWRDRSGKLLGSVLDSVSDLGRMNLSRDGRRLAYKAESGGIPDIWILDLQKNVNARFTSNAPLPDYPQFTPSGDEIIYALGTNPRRFFIQSTNGSNAPRPLFSSPTDGSSGSWSPDGTTLAFSSIDPDSGINLWLASRNPDGSFGRPQEFLRTQDNEGSPEFSPDGRFIAYQSDETGRWEIYVRPLKDGGGKRLVSSNGGIRAQWRADGKELFYLQGDSLMAVPVTGSVTLSFGRPVELFPIARVSGGIENAYVVHPDGKRFIVAELRDSDKQRPPQIHVVQNWPALLRQATTTPAQDPQP